MIKFIMSFILIVCLIPVTVFAGPYFSVAGGMSQQQDYNLHHVKFTHSTGSALSVAGGWDFRVWKYFGFRTEVEWLRLSSGGDRIVSIDQTNSVPYNVNTTTNFFFVNGMAYVPVYKDRVNLVGGGGYAGGSKFQVFGGLELNVGESWTFGLTYKRVVDDYKARSYDPATGIDGPMPPCCGPSSTIQTSGHAEDEGRPYNVLMIGLSYEF